MSDYNERVNIKTMQIVHIAPNAPYNDNWGYQENLLPKYQRKMNNDVTVIITNKEHKDGAIVETSEKDYYLKDGIHIIRRKCKPYMLQALTGLFAFIPVYDLLKEIKPDFIFFHGLNSLSIYDAIKYKKRLNKSCIIVQDNHLDYYNSRSVSDIKGLAIRALYRLIAKNTIGDIQRVYGVTPWRERFLHDYYRIPKTKTDVLIMGADDEKIRFDRRGEIRKEIRNQYHITDNEFFIITGGKIDEAKKIHLLMKAVNEIDNVKLLIFGEIESDIQEQINKQKSVKNILIGWIPAEKTYDYYLASDLVCFPGTHSVMWEQACACKVPCLFAQWDGMDHVNNGGNSDFISEITTEGIKTKIQELLFTEKYYRMKKTAESNKTDIYLYSAIAKKSLEMLRDKV